MVEKKGLRKWLWEQRSSARLAYVLHLSTRILSSFFALIWIRFLVGAMGIPLNSLYLAFQNVFSFGGLGDLGMGGAVGIRVGRYLGEGKGKEEELRKFLASARTVFLFLAVVVGAGMLLLSPWLPHWLRFSETAGSGPLPNVFAMGTLLMAGVLLSSYISNLNYACGNVAWPVLPDLLLLQLSLLCHWLLARQHQPLWIQYLPYVIAAAARFGLTWFYVRTSHPPLGKLLPLTFDWRMTVSLFESSFWLYLCTLGNVIYRSTDGLVINAGFPLGTLAGYNYNYKFCELVVFIVLTASFVSLPKITRWMASSDPQDQARVRVEMQRLNQFQTLLGCGAALAYLGGNSLFMKIWWLHKENPILPAAMPLQLAFALNLAVTTSGDAGIQLAMRSGKRGLRVAGAVIGLTGILNLVLSIVAMKMNSLVGIAMATVVAQSVSSLVASFYICRHLQIKWLPWALKGWFFPLAGISFAAWLRMLWPLDSWPHTLLLITAYVALLALAAWGLGIKAAFIKEELKIVKKFFRK